MRVILNFRQYDCLLLLCYCENYRQLTTSGLSGKAFPSFHDPAMVGLDLGASLFSMHVNHILPIPGSFSWRRSRLRMKKRN